MIEHILEFISQLTPFWIYVALFFFSFIENVFPPSPSDLVVIVGGSLIGTGELHFIPTLIITTIGSVIGFMTLFYIGTQLDRKVIQAGKIKFISIEALTKVELWFKKWGYWIILANRFLPGTRSVISFFAGLSELDFRKTAVLATISALVWNAVIIYLGVIFGNNIEIIDRYLSTYKNIAWIITGLMVAVIALRLIFKKRKAAK
jgi:membrane protein DedA with SNARE-associated domain